MGYGEAAATLASSYSNFPNPFAAGRTSTAFTYVLAQDATVTLQIWTATGDKVTTLIPGQSRGAGLHQDDRWNGLNGAGRPVVNGVYLAELMVSYPDGTHERLLRKVAVTR